MKAKYLIVLFLLLAVVVLVLSISRRPTGEESPLLPGLKTEEISGVEIRREGRSLRLDRRNGEWVIETAWDHPASAAAVENLLRRLQSITVGHPVSSSRQRHPLFKVGADGYRVDLLDHSGSIRHSVVVGKRGEDMLSSFVRRADSDEVFLWRQSLDWVVNAETNRWMERDLWGISAADCRAFSVKTADGEYRWERDDEKEWRPVSPETGDVRGRRAGELLSLLIGVRPLELAGRLPEFEERFAAPFMRYRFISREGEEFEAVVGEREGNRYYFQLQGIPFAYRVGASPLDEAVRRLAPPSRSNEGT